MPDFPIYHGELPRCLDLRNPRHYLLLIYWIYFRPAALKSYLYRADPDFYRSGPRLLTFRIPAYRNLYLMAPVLTVFSSTFVGLPVMLVIGWIQGTSVSWIDWLLSTAGGMLFGMVISLAFGVAFGSSSGGVGNVAFGIAGGVASGVAFSSILNGARDPVGSIVGLIFFGVIWGLAFGVTVGASRFVAGGVILGIASGAVGGLALASLGLESGNAILLVMTGAVGSVLGAVIFGIGALRIPFYPIQIIFALYHAYKGRKHSLEWDELTVLPIPGTRKALARRLHADEEKGLYLVAQVTYNPFQRWTAQSVLQSYLHNHPKPIHLIYTLLTRPDLDTYIPAPLSEGDWKELPSVTRLLLGELDREEVKYGRDWVYWFADRLVWRLTWKLCDRRITPLTRFSGMLYELLDKDTTSADEFDLTVYSDIYTDLAGYPGGKEVAQSFAAMAAFLKYSDIFAVPAANHVVSEIGIGNDVIRPTVLAALDNLGQVGAEVAAYRDATSRVNKLAALARATDILDNLDDYVVTEVMAPEQYILRRIIRQWRRLISEAGGEAGRLTEAGPVANPYVAGNPVEGNLFVGREDIMRRLEELWIGEGQKPSVVLFGHRRMGKSSILHNLGARFGSGTVVVDFNMQRVGLVENTGELLHNMALALYDSLPNLQEGLEEPDAARFTNQNPYTAFDRFLRQIDRARGDRRFIVAVDEFELIEKAIAEEQLEPRLLDFWRGLIQTYPWFVMAFAGLHTLQEMTHDYWHPLYGSVTPIPVSFLSREASRRLITQPTPEFSLDYERDAVESIITLTNGQPYLVQLIGHGLVTRFNRQTFEEDIERERRFSLADVEAVINAPDFYRDGDAYFTGVWRQAGTSKPAGQTTVLHALAQSEEDVPIDVITRQAALEPEETLQALETLSRHDIVAQVDGRWHFTVELMRRWVMRK